MAKRDLEICDEELQYYAQVGYPGKDPLIMQAVDIIWWEKDAKAKSRYPGAPGCSTVGMARIATSIAMTARAVHNMDSPPEEFGWTTQQELRVEEHRVSVEKHVAEIRRRNAALLEGKRKSREKKKKLDRLAVAVRTEKKVSFAVPVADAELLGLFRDMKKQKLNKEIKC